MPFPSTQLTKAQLDAGTDAPAQARIELEAAIDKINEIITSYALALGICDLDAAGKVPAARLPAGVGSGVDADLLDGQHGDYYRNAGNLNAGTLPAARFADSSHGDRAGGSLHAAATQAVAGFMSAGDKVLVDTFSSWVSGLIGQARLKTAQASYTVTLPGTFSNGDYTLVETAMAGGEYGFMPTHRSSSSFYIASQWQANDNKTTVGCWLDLLAYAIGASSNTHYAYFYQRYVSASPPYALGGRDDWGHFLYMLRRVSDGLPIGCYEAVDPPWAYNGKLGDKNSADVIQAVPHPFSKYYDRDPAADGLEIVLVDMANMRTEEWLADAGNQAERSILEDLSPIKNKGRIADKRDFAVLGGFADRIKVLR